MKSKLTIDIKGNKIWKLPNGRYHREDGPAVEYNDGSKHWYINGLLHREDGPTIITANAKHWYINGERHREDGAAVEYNDGNKLWWVNGKQYNEKEYKYETRSIKLNKLLL